MSGIVIEDEAWRRIFADEQLSRARSRLSFHEIRLIVQHVRDSGRLPEGEDSRSEAECAASQSGGATSAASPKPTPPNHPSNREAT